MTKYMVLRRNRDQGTEDDLVCWQFHCEAEASGAERAIRSIKDLEPGAYIAIPARSFRPLTVTVETTTRIAVK